MIPVPPTEWAELIEAHDDRNVFQASPDELPTIDIHSVGPVSDAVHECRETATREAICADARRNATAVGRVAGRGTATGRPGRHPLPLRSRVARQPEDRCGSAIDRAIRRPFPKPKTGRIAVKVINQLSDEVMKVFNV